VSKRNKWIIGIFTALMIGHWLEHIFQAYQVYAMHMPRACALGMLGMKYPWLVRTESLHFGFALFTTLGLIMLWRVFVTGKVAPDSVYCLSTFERQWGFTSRPWWITAFFISVWHLFEHSLLFYQAIAHHNFWGSPVPISVIQLIVPRIELHLFYNSLVTFFIAIAMEKMWVMMHTPPVSITNCTVTLPSDGSPASMKVEHVRGMLPQ
jgi:hypothetical protein